MDAEEKQRLTLGEFLQQVREKKGLSVEQVADELKLKISTVKALEANNYAEVGRMVYVKGYLRSYAKLMHVNIEKALLRFDENAEDYLANIGKNNLHQKQAEQSMTSSTNLVAVWFAVVVFVIIILVAYFWYQHHDQDKIAQENTTLATTATAVPTSAAPAAPTTGAVAPAPAPQSTKAAAVKAEPASSAAEVAATPIATNLTEAKGATTADDASVSPEDNTTNNNPNTTE